MASAARLDCIVAPSSSSRGRSAVNGSRYASLRSTADAPVRSRTVRSNALSARSCSAVVRDARVAPVENPVHAVADEHVSRRGGHRAGSSRAARWSSSSAAAETDGHDAPAEVAHLLVGERRVDGRFQRALVLEQRCELFGKQRVRGDQARPPRRTSRPRTRRRAGAARTSRAVRSQSSTRRRSISRSLRPASSISIHPRPVGVEELRRRSGRRVTEGLEPTCDLERELRDVRLEPDVAPSSSGREGPSPRAGCAIGRSIRDAPSRRAAARPRLGLAAPPRSFQRSVSTVRATPKIAACRTTSP